MSGSDTAPVAVLVIGGGPVGLATALELSHHGVPVTVLEPRRTVEHGRPRAKTTSARTMEHFRRWGVAERLRAAAPIPVSWSHRATFAPKLLAPEITHIEDCLGLTTPPEISPETSQQIPQGIVEETLRAELATCDKVDFRLGWRAISVVDGPDGARVEIVDDTGAIKHIHARWVVGADGPRSVVRDAMGARYEGAAAEMSNVNVTFRSPRLWESIPHPPSIHYWIVAPDRSGVVGPLDLEGTWWSAAVGVDAVRDDDHAAEVVRSLIGADVPLDVIATDTWTARMLLADRYRSGHLFVVGDAAHQNPPWGGHGFNTGVGDAANLGWKLAAVIHGWAAESLLDTYESERRPIAAATIEVATRNMTALSATEAGTSRDQDVAARIRSTKDAEFHADGLVFGYGYGPDAAAQSPALGTYVPLLATGNRLPHRMVHGRPIFDLLGREFSVIGPAGSADALLAAAKKAGVPLTHVVADGPVVVVRPDQHVAWAGDRFRDAAAFLDAITSGHDGDER